MRVRSEQLQAAWWLAVGAALLWVLWLLRATLTPFLAAAVLAFILNPGVDWLARRRVPRVGAAAAMLVLLFFGLLAVFLVVAPLIHRETVELAAHLPPFLARLDAAIAPQLEVLFGKEVHLDLESLAAFVTSQVKDVDGIAGRVLAVGRSGGAAVASLLGNLVLIPMVLFYLLLDWHGIVARIDRLVPRRFHAPVRRIAAEIDGVLAEFLRGQLSVMGLLAVYYTAALWLLGVDFALPIGLVTGGLAFVPYLGFATGLGLALLGALLQPAGSWALVAVAAVFACGQVLESFFLTPRIVGQRIGLHPLAVIFALLAFGQVFGFFGVLLALPASAVILVGLRHLKDAYLQSDFYART
jgi:predicted PurR-regulated permease PerM